MTDKLFTRQLVAFAILMENFNGIREKAPSYILQKYRAVMNMAHPENLLDSSNKSKFEKWVKIWEK